MYGGVSMLEGNGKYIAKAKRAGDSRLSIEVAAYLEYYQLCFLFSLKQSKNKTLF